MKWTPDRRRFLINGICTGATLGAYNLGALLEVAQAQEQDADGGGRQSKTATNGIHYKYLHLGLSALARAHRSNTMAGHLGAALIAGHFISEQHPDLDDGVFRGMERELDRIVSGASVFSPRKGGGISVKELFEPFPRSPNAKVDESLIDGIAEALAQNLDQTRQSGHNVIFASSAIRALKRHPEFCTPAITDGVRKLIAAFDGKTPGSGYYGKQRGRIDGRKIQLPTSDDFPTHPNLSAMANSVLEDLIQHGDERRVGYGGLTHVINHGAALVELANYGYRELADKGLEAHHQHMQLWRTLPDVSDEPGQDAPKLPQHDPRTPEFWQTGDLPTAHAKLTHRIKTLYGFDALTTVVPESTQRHQAEERLNYLL